MATACFSLQFGEEKIRPLFGLSFGEAGVVLLSYLLAHNVLPTAGHGALALGAPALMWIVLLLGHHVRVEPVASQLTGFVLRRVLGQPKEAARLRAYTILEVDGFTRDALTEDEQETRLIGRLQGLIASLGAGGLLQLIALTEPRHAGRTQVVHFYVVVYDTKTRERALPLPGWLRRLLDIPPREQGADLADLVVGVADVLAVMGLRAQPVTHVASAHGPVLVETPSTALTYDEGTESFLFAASTYMLLPPSVTNPGFLDPLVAMDGAHRLSIWIEGLDADAERARLALRQKQVGASLFAGVMRGTRVSVDEEAAAGENDEMILRLRRPEEGVVRCGVYLTCLGDTPLEARRRVRRMRMVMRQRVGARPASGIGHQACLYRATLPGRDLAGRSWRMHAATVANAYPFNRRNPTTGSGYPIGVTDRGEDVRFDPTDESLRNALCVSVGLSGMGKSVIALKLLRSHLLAGGRATILDRSGHYGLLGALVSAVTIETAAALDAVPIETQMVIVDLRRAASVEADLLAALDKRTQTVVGDGLHLFVLEEAWQLEFMGAALWVNDLARRGRHWAGFVWWITHEPEDLVRHPQIKSMFSAAATKIVFALDDREGTATRLGVALGATPQEVQIIKALPVGHCYLMRHNKNRGSVVRGEVRVQLDAFERWCFETDPRSWQHKRRAVEIARRRGDVQAALTFLADNVPFEDDTLEREETG